MRRISDWGVAGIILAFVSGFVWFVVNSIERPDGPLGSPIPTEPPDEANRVHHPSGISLVLPPYWLLSRHDFFDARPRDIPGRRSKAFIVITSNGSSAQHDTAGWSSVLFQGQPAKERMVVEREYTLDDGALSCYSLWFQRSGRTYLVKYGLAEERTELPAMVRKYLETMTFDPVATGREGK